MYIISSHLSNSPKIITVEKLSGGKGLEIKKNIRIKSLESITTRQQIQFLEKIGKQKRKIDCAVCSPLS